LVRDSESLQRERDNGRLGRITDGVDAAPSYRRGRDLPGSPIRARIRETWAVGERARRPNRSCGPTRRVALEHEQRDAAHRGGRAVHHAAPSRAQESRESASAVDTRQRSSSGFFSPSMSATPLPVFLSLANPRPQQSHPRCVDGVALVEVANAPRDALLTPSSRHEWCRLGIALRASRPGRAANRCAANAQPSPVTAAAKKPKLA
jgi:hypothetical protein